MKVFNDIDLKNNKIKNGGFDALASAPTSPFTGQSYFDTTLGTERVWNGSTWLAKSSTGATGVSVYAFSVDPTASDDNTLGYNTGDRWINTTENNEFVLIDSSTGAAVWKKTTEIATDSSGNVVFENTVVFEGAVAFGSSVTYNVTGTDDNINPTGLDSSNYLRLTGSGSITGIVAPSPALNQILFVINVGSSNITLRDSNSGSSAQNRLFLKSNKLLQPDESISLLYDDVDLVWRAVGRNT